MKKIIKKCLIKYLLKYFQGSSKNYYYQRDHLKFYLFLRWLSEFVKNEEDTQDVMISLAHYMHYNRTVLPFTDIFVIENIVCVCTTRPGLWIGKSGSVMDSILKKLNFNIDDKKIHNFKIQLLETTRGAIADINSYINIYQGNYYDTI